MAVRVPNTEVVLPIIVGTVAIHLGKKTTDQKTHQWTVYVRSANNEDISHIVPKVVFKLHPSFAQPVRPVEGPSFELTETGWGEFDIQVELHFAQDSGEKPIEIFHRLKLYADDDPTGQTRKPVVSELYEEIVFSQPYQGFYQRVMAAASQPRPRAPLSCEAHIKPPSEADELQNINDMRRKVAVMSAQLRMQLQQQPTDSPTAMGMHM